MIRFFSLWFARPIHLLRQRDFSGALFLLAVIAGLAVFGAPEAWGRAGGGDSFSGGGGGGGGYSSGSSGSSSGDSVDLYILIQLLRGWIWFCYHYPYIGIPVTIVGGYLFLASCKGAKSAYTGQVIRQGESARLEGQQLGLTARIRQISDPNFSAEAFHNRVRTAFVTAQNAWCAQDLSPLRPFVSDGIFERWSLQIARQKAEGWRGRLTGLTIRHILIANYSLSGKTEELTVCITATASDVRVSLSTGQPLAEQPAPEAFSEYWTFLRRKGAAAPRDGQGLLEGHCPNCGTPVGINQHAKCESCGAFLRSGAYDWILTEISQAGVYSHRSDSGIAGLPALRAADPEFSPRLLEDRAAVAFWRWQQALWEGKSARLRGLCGDALYDAVTQQFRAGGQEYKDPAVGAVDLLGVQPVEEGYRALIEIVWSGTGAGESKAVRRQMFLFSRPYGETSESSNRVGSAHCPSCGAPEQADAAGRCAFCGQPLLTGGQWRLDQILSSGSETALRYQTELREMVALQQADGQGDDAGAPSAETAEDEAAGRPKGFSPSAYAAVGWMAKVMTADGELDDKERELLLAAAKARGLPRPTAEHLITAGLAGQLEIPEPRDLPQARDWLQALARMALIDGKLKPAEVALLQKFAAKSGYSDFDLEQFLKQVRGDLYRESRENIRQTRQLRKTVSLNRE